MRRWRPRRLGQADRRARRAAAAISAPTRAMQARRLGACTIQGETVSLGQQMAQQGFAINVPGKDRFAGDEAKARIEHSGLWRGCFAAPQSFRRWDRDAVLLGASCRDDKRAETVELLFPARTTMPPGCPIKGKSGQTGPADWQCRRPSPAGLPQPCRQHQAGPLVLLRR
ncbi:MAG: hypothetical protein MZV49_22780 [Rhodopseudomonas palustris]|nr:hypothetical protein [Rhodopseudomonas palustris]